MYRRAVMLAILLIFCSIATVTLGLPLDPSEEVVAYDDLMYSYNPPNPQERAESLGYTAETHEVVTTDGYILQVFRIKGSWRSPPDFKKPVVLLLHGLMDCASGWVVTCREKSLAFILADAGYDVWLGNARGNRYARQHKWMTTKEKKYWLFSWHEIGVYDIPAMIDHALEVSKQKKLIYVGHSQGTTAFFVMASLRPEYHEKVEAMFALAPVVFMGRKINPLLRILAPFVDDLEKIADLIGMYEFMPTQGLIHDVGEMVCGKEAITKPLCDTAMVFVVGFGEKYLNETLIPDVLKYDPAGAATRQVVHYAQLINSGKFHQYNHGWIDNLKQYGTLIPPDYPVENINIPIYLHYSSSDIFASVDDVYRLYKKLPNCKKFLVPEQEFSHIDFIFGGPADTFVYYRILGLMERHRRNLNSSEIL